MDIVCLFTYLQFTEHFHVRIQYLIITETSCIGAMCYKLCKGINYLTTSCT